MRVLMCVRACVCKCAYMRVECVCVSVYVSECVCLRAAIVHMLSAVN